MVTKSTVPTDLIFQILCLSDPRDIIRWRTVSKMFNALTRETALWKTLYRNASFPRPPGPFSTQSVASLQRTLHKAERLAESWMTRPMRALSSLTINTEIPRINAPITLPYPKFISGRWLVVLESDQRFVLHDVDPAAGKHIQQVLWEQKTSKVSHWNVESIVSSEGHCVLYVLLKFCDLPGWKLLEFCLNHDTGDLLHSTTIDPPEAGCDLPRAFLYAGNSKLIFLTVGQMVFDTRTRLFYKNPLSHKDPHANFDWIVVSDTTLMALDRLDYQTIIYVFALPPGSDGGETSPRTLCLTHEGTIYRTSLSHVKVMKHAIDPATGETNIRLLDHSVDLEPLELQCVDITLPRSIPGVILPINIEKRQIQLPRERMRPSRYEHHCKYIDISPDGQIRGFYRARRRSQRRPWETEENQLVVKFTIDTTQEPWVVVRGQIAPAEWSNEEDPNADSMGRYIAFDGMRGRLCYAHPDVRGKLIVADIE